MIEFKTGDMFGEDVEALVNTVNCVGVMGRGVALKFKEKFPLNFKMYAQACERDEVQLGRMFITEVGGLVNPRFIINFPTKKHWRSKSRISDIEAGLVDLAREIEQREIRTIAIPPLGAGLGGLEWVDVKSRIASVLGDIQGTRIIVYEPSSGPEQEAITQKSKSPRMTKSRAVLIALIRMYLDGALDPYATLLEVHKLMYFMQEAGERLRLDYEKHLYGPYATNLRHVMRAIEGHMIAGFQEDGDNPFNEVELVPGSVERAQNFLGREAETHRRLDRVASLVNGFETDYGMELLSTIHWIATREKPVTLKDVIAKTYAWNERKKQFPERHITDAFDRLVKGGWVVPL